ncbi:poly(A)-binding protein binding protein [Tilletia horrida]|nr:poly(A)-binding protein binding protein [Tilletia horrida]
MAAPSVKGRGGGSINNANRGGRNGTTGGNSSLGANSRWSSGPPRQLGSNTNSGNAANAATTPSSAAASATTPAPAATPANEATRNSASATSAFPSLGGPQAGENAQAKMHERMVFILTSLVGTMVTVTARGGVKYVGLLSAASTEQGELGASLASAQQVISSFAAAPELGPPKGAVIVLGRDLDEIEAWDVKLGDPASDARAAEKDSFRTDTDISKAQYDALGGGRVLQKWSDDPGLDVAEAAHAASLGINGTPSRNQAFGGLEDGHKSGGGGGGGAWDQFAVNERQFGVRSNYDEDIYTTKLDRSGKDFKERERNAERLAREILNSTTSNPHLAEERNHAATEAAAGGDEEAKYGAVQRGPNAYVPPAARRAGGGGALPASNKATSSTTPAAQPATSKAAPPKPAPASSAAPAAAAGNIKPPTVVLQSGSNDATPEIPTKKVAPADVSKEFSKFVSSERERMYAKRKEVQKKEMQNELAALKVWHGNFQLKTPIPDDLDSPLRNKNTKDNISDKPRDPSLQKSLSPNATHAEAAKPGAIRALLQTTAESNSPRLPPFNRNIGSSSNPSGLHATSKPPAPKMVIPKIPPFNPDRLKARQAEKAAGVATPSTSATLIKDATGATTGATASKDVKTDAATVGMKLSAKASAFKPFNPNASAFTPGAPAAKKTETTSAAPASSTPQNPFFGSRTLKRPASHAPLHLREEFNPFKVSKVPEATSISPEWRFTGKPFRNLFTAVPPATPATAPMVPFAEDQSFSMGPPQPNMPLQPGMVPMVPGGPHPGHGPPPAMQPHHPGPQVPHTGPPPHSGGPPQQMAIPFGGQPQFYPRFQQPHQPFPHQMPMPGAQGMAYGAMPPQFVGQMPFSPPMPHGPHPVYSPQMANMPPPGQHPQFIPQQGPMPGPMPTGQPHGPGGGPGRGPHPPRSQGPQQMYFQQQGPVHAMPYGHQPHFMPGRPPGMPPMDGSFPGGQMADPNNNHMG